MTRDEAITRLKNMAWLYGSTEREQNIEAIDMAIEALSADRPQGEWKLVTYKRINEHGEVVIDGYSWRCSNCGDARKRNEPDMKFCSNCGADMRGDDSE